MDAQIVYDDVWGSIIDHPQADYIEIRWYDTTSAMTAVRPITKPSLWVHRRCVRGNPMHVASGLSMQLRRLCVMQPQ